MRRLLYCLGGLAAVAVAYGLVFAWCVALHRWPLPASVASILVAVAAYGRWRR